MTISSRIKLFFITIWAWLRSKFVAELPPASSSPLLVAARTPEATEEEKLRLLKIAVAVERVGTSDVGGSVEPCPICSSRFVVSETAPGLRLTHCISCGQYYNFEETA